jgi:transposase-like protein
MGNTVPLSGEVWMPWKECSVVDERLRFVAQPLDGEAMSEVCRAFGISRKTGYKIFERYKQHGLEALTDRSRRPVRYASQLPRQIESLIVAAKRGKQYRPLPSLNSPLKSAHQRCAARTARSDLPRTDTTCRARFHLP